MWSDWFVFFVVVAVGLFVFFYSSPSGDDDTDKKKKLTDTHSTITKDSSSTGCNLMVLYGSQTGTAQDYAARLVKEASQQYGLDATLLDLMDCSGGGSELLLNAPSTCLVIFVLATYGDGEPTDSAQDFSHWLKEQCENNQTDNLLLSNLNYTVFGLGNRTYTQFNAMARETDARLLKLGATAVHPRGEGDDDNCLEEDFMRWNAEMWKSALQFLKIDPSTIKPRLARSFNFSLVNRDVQVDSFPSSKRHFTGELGVLGSWNGKQNRVTYDVTHPYYAPVSLVRNLYERGICEQDAADISRECFHVELDITGTSLRYQSGDHVGIYAPNDEREVLKLAEALGIADKLDCVFDMRTPNNSGPIAKRTPFPCPTTFRAALMYYLDIMTLPRMHVLSLLAGYATDASEKEHLLQISSIQSKHEYHSYIVDAGRNLCQVLLDHPSVHFEIDQQAGLDELTLGDLFEILPRLQPRYYSISSSSRSHSNHIHVAASVVRYKTKLGKLVEGVVTGHMSRMFSDTETNSPATIRLPIFLRKSHFKLPRNYLTPIIMIGPGTGVAPLRAFIHDRKAILDMKVKEWYIKKKVDPLDCNTVSSTSLWNDSQAHYISKPGKIVVRRVFDHSTNETNRPPVEKMIGETLLFFGCRNRSEDFIYRDELISGIDINNMTDETVLDATCLHDGLTSIYCAFSREQSEKCYVQQLLAENRANVWKVLANNGYVYVCGDAKNMAKDVSAVFLDIAQDASYGNMSLLEANTWIKKLKDSGRYQEDVWS